jgi:hypothetical protein
MAAARRWLPWLCAYSGARVNELTSLYPADIAPDKETNIWCMVIKPSLEKNGEVAHRADPLAGDRTGLSGLRRKAPTREVAAFFTTQQGRAAASREIHNSRKSPSGWQSGSKGLASITYLRITAGGIGSRASRGT